MLTAPGSNERMDYLSLPRSLSDFGIYFGEGAARPIASNNRPAPAAARLTAPGLNERLDCPGGGADFRIRTRRHGY